ncbi:MAG: S8 family serine peptidase [Bacteroidota bacterium]|nr:S8 family serine peptidase [Bacteroidota bacterium]
MLQVKKILSLTLLLAMTSSSFAQSKSVVPEKSSPSISIKADHMAKTVIIKVLPANRSLCSATSISDPAFISFYNSIGGTGLSKKFPHSPAPQKMINERGEKLADLSLIYEFSYTASTPLEKVISRLQASSLFQYAEPHYIPQLCYTPNDPLLSSQWGMVNIQAENAWGVNTTTARGDTNIVIGITDTGVEPLHPDLINKIKRNPLDPAGGGDNDGDGYTDNYRGWDLGDNDNDPTWSGSPHGVHVAGIAAAQTNNALGISGTGFNTKFLPVKIADNTGALTKAYEGITYAADHGCAIINCSWGGGGSGQFGQDVITYATINKNSLVIAAAGNNGLDEAFYPAAYQYVISVGNTKTDDRRSSSSNYNYTLDVCAPGEGINSTYSGTSYSVQTGTSMSAPCAAGAAAIIKSFYPTYTALQVGERLKVTCDNIYPLHSPIYANKLGNGRINMFKSLTAVASPSVVMTTRNTNDYNDNTYVVGDTVRINGDFTNYLAPTINLTATISTTSPFISIIDNSATLGAINTLAIGNNNSDPWEFVIQAGAALNQVCNFKVTYSDPSTSYSAVEYFTLTVNVDYINITVNDVHTTVNSRGRIGYNQDGQVGGLGFNYMAAGSILYEAGLMIGTGGSQVSDAVRGTAAGADLDFQSIVNAHVVTPYFSEFDVDGYFRDNISPAPLPVTVHHKAFAWSTTGNRKYVIVEYVITNTGGTALNNLYAGIFADWDIDAATFTANRASFDAGNKMGYAYHTATSGIYAGIKLLTNTAPVTHYAVDNLAGGAGGADLSDGFDGTEKYLTMSTNRSDAGVGGTGADVIDIVSTGPYSIPSGDSVVVAFALIAGDNLADIQSSAVNADIMYNGVATSVQNTSMGNDGFSVYPNPAGSNSVVEFSMAEAAKVELKVFSVVGTELKTIASEEMSSGTHRFVTDLSGLSKGIYLYELTIGNKKYVKKLMLSK